MFKCGRVTADGSDSVKVERIGRGISAGTARLTVIFFLASIVLAAVPQTPAFAYSDDWLKFDEGNEWDQSFDRSFAQQWETQPNKGYPTLSNENIPHMNAVIKRYADIVANGGWDKLPLVELRVGKTHPAVTILRRRLQTEGDLERDSGGYPETFDYYVEKAVKRAQMRNGLAPTGVLDKNTILALNVPASARLRQLRTNVVRIKSSGAPAKGRYVAVNIPAAQIEAVENNEIVSRHAGVVGKVDRQTPILKSQIHEINFNKEWFLPPTVIREDLLPKARSKDGAQIFDKYGIDVYQDYGSYQKGRKLNPHKVNWSNQSSNSLFFTQKPGEENPLGFLKINFHNPYSVYMHDTPSKSIFSRNFRAESSGCVRIQNIPELAAWLLRDNGWSLAQVNRMKQTGETLNVQLKTRIPLYFTYVTSWATPDGMAHFRRDLYQRDGVGVTATAY